MTIPWHTEARTSPPHSAWELTELVDQVADVFVSSPGLTHLVYHGIKTPPGLVVRQQPYCILEAGCQAIEDEIS